MLAEFCDLRKPSRDCDGRRRRQHGVWRRRGGKDDGNHARAHPEHEGECSRGGGGGPKSKHFNAFVNLGDKIGNIDDIIPEIHLRVDQAWTCLVA